MSYGSSSSSSTDRVSKRSLAALGALLAVHIFLGLAFIHSAAPTYDEPVHLAAGYTYWETGRYRLNIMDHPPLAEMWAAIPLLFLHPALFLTHPDWISGRLYGYSDYFLFHNAVSAETLMTCSRVFAFVTWTALLAWALLSWARRIGGDAAMIATAAIYAFTPALISNLSLVTTDGGSAVLFFAAVALLANWSADGVPAADASAPRSRRSQKPDSRKPNPGSMARWALAGACAGLANAAKFNMITLAPILVVLVFMDREVSLAPRPEIPWKGFFIFCAAGIAALVVAYRFDQVPLYWKGLSATLGRLDQGRPSFFFGHYSKQGFLLYFPAALAIKTPLATWILAAFGLWALPKKAKLWAIVPPVLYFAAAMRSKVDIGYRHVLPVVPFVALWAGVGAGRLWGLGKTRMHSGLIRGACGVLIAWQAASVARCCPYYLAYFNEAVGGPSQGYRYLVDSNLDWGQDLPSLAREVRALGDPPIYLSYFGTADPAHYGLKFVPVASGGDVVSREANVADPSASGKVLFAVSATQLQAAYFVNKGLFDWLKARSPLKAIGHSIFLYDLTDDRDAREHLAALLAASGQPFAARQLAAR